MLSDIVQISRQYQRSIRVDADIGRADALTGYICHATATSVVDGMGRQLAETNQRCFTWTGPFGGGKSSLAVALASALHPDKSLRAHARNALNLGSMPAFDKAFPVRKGWLVVPAVGRRGSVVAELHAALRKAKARAPTTAKRRPPTLSLSCAKPPKTARTTACWSSSTRWASSWKPPRWAPGTMSTSSKSLPKPPRAPRPLGGRGRAASILRAVWRALGIDTRDDWAKVQGRYVDLPFVAASDEVVELIGRAIEAKRRPPWMREASKAIAEAIRSRRPAVGESSPKPLEACWPLHPAMAALLGPISKRQFGQNERSTFGFLSSVEPHGFRSYLQLDANRTRRPGIARATTGTTCARTLEPAILASPDGHRWSQAVEAVERAEAKTGDPLLVALIKNIAVIDLFRNGSGLAADSAVIGPSSTRQPSPRSKTRSKSSLAEVALFKSYTGAWSVFEGSDFDIDAAIAQALGRLAWHRLRQLAQLMGLHPVVAKRHYHETGSMRWMELSLCSIERSREDRRELSSNEGRVRPFISGASEQGHEPESRAAQGARSLLQAAALGR